MGLQPGNYYAEIDNAQLVKLNLSSSQPKVFFTIKKSREGDIVEGMKFWLSPAIVKK